MWMLILPPKASITPKTIEIVDLAKAFDRKMAAETRMLNINPFTHVGAFPTYPKTLEAEVDELNRVKADKAARGRNRGGRLYDDDK